MGAARSTLPSAVRGTPGVGTFSHCAASGRPVTKIVSDVISNFMALPLSREAVIARYVFDVEIRHHALAVFNEFDGQPREAGKLGFRPRKLLLFSSSIHLAE